MGHSLVLLLTRNSSNRSDDSAHTRNNTKMSRKLLYNYVANVTVVTMLFMSQQERIMCSWSQYLMFAVLAYLCEMPVYVVCMCITEYGFCLSYIVEFDKTPFTAVCLSCAFYF